MGGTKLIWGKKQIFPLAQNGHIYIHVSIFLSLIRYQLQQTDLLKTVLTYGQKQT